MRERQPRALRGGSTDRGPGELVRLSVTGRRRHVKHQNLRASCHGSCETHELPLSHGQVILGDLEVQTVGGQKARQVGLSGHVHELVVGVLVEGLEEEPHGALQDERRLPNDANLGPEVLEAKVGMTTLSMRI